MIKNGIELLREYIANVHIKNASWVRQAGNWTWQWDGLQQGMVEWPGAGRRPTLPVNRRRRWPPP